MHFYIMIKWKNSFKYFEDDFEIALQWIWEVNYFQIRDIWWIIFFWTFLFFSPFFYSSRLRACLSLNFIIRLFVWPLFCFSVCLSDGLIVYLSLFFVSFNYLWNTGFVCTFSRHYKYHFFYVEYQDLVEDTEAPWCSG